MATVPIDAPQVAMHVPGMTPVQAGEVRPIQDFRGKQIADLGQGMMAAGQAAIKIEDQIDDAGHKRLYNNFSEELGKITDEFKSLQGQNAITAEPEFQKQVAELKKKYSGGAENDVVRSMFDRSADVRINSARSEVRGHYLQSVQAYEIGETVANINTNNNNAVRYKNDTTKSAMYRTAAIVAADQLAERKGLGKDAKNAILQENDDKYFSSLINSYITDGLPSKAADVLSKNSDKISEVTREQLTKLTKVSTDQDAGLKLAMGLTGSLSSQQKYLDDKFKNGDISPDVFRIARSEIEHRYTISKQQEAESDKNLLDSVESWAIKNPNGSWQTIDPRLKVALENNPRVFSAASSFFNHGRYITDPSAIAEIYNMSPADLSKMTEAQFYTQYRGKLDNSDMSMGLARLAASKGSQDPKHLQVISTDDQLKQAAVNLKIYPATGKPSDKQATNFYNFRTDVNQRVIAFEQTQLGGKRKATNEELQKIVDTYALDNVSVPGIVYGTNVKHISELGPEEKNKARVTITDKYGIQKTVKLSDIPKADRAQIIEAFITQGLPVTEQKIAEVYFNKK